MVESDRVADYVVVEPLVPLDTEIHLVDDTIVVTPVVDNILASPRGGIYLDGEMYRETSSPSGESDN